MTSATNRTLLLATLTASLLRSDDATATRTSKITIGLVDKTTALRVHFTFLYISNSLPFLPTTTWKCLILLFTDDVNKRRRNFILFQKLNMVLRNSTPGGFTYIWKRKWVGMIAIKTARTQIHFWSDAFFTAVESSDRKVHIRELKQRRRRRQRERQKSNRFRLAKQLCSCITLFCRFLCRLCTTTTWKCLKWRFVEDGKTQQQISFSFPEL